MRLISNVQRIKEILRFNILPFNNVDATASRPPIFICKCGSLLLNSALAMHVISGNYGIEIAKFA